MKYGFQKAKEAEEKMGRTVAGCPFRIGIILCLLWAG